MTIRTLLMEARKVDEDFSIQPLEEGDEGLIFYEPSNVPLNHTDLQANIMISERSSFKKQKPWGKGAEEVDKDEMQNPIVDFSFVFSCNKPNITTDITLLTDPLPELPHLASHAVRNLVRLRRQATQPAWLADQCWSSYF